MDENLIMRVHISLGYSCEGRCMDKDVEFEIPVTAEEKQLLNQLPGCQDGKTTQLQMLIPIDLYRRMREAALHHVEDQMFIHGFENGLYILDARRWFLKDLSDGKFCKKAENNMYIDPGTNILYEEDDEGLFELWQEYEDKCYKEQGIAYLRERYGKELSEQTDLANIKWSMEF